MTGTTKHLRLSAVLLGAMALGACDENGEFAFPVASDEGAQAAAPANAPGQTVQGEIDVERPDIFEVTDRGLWDGRPSLGGVWVAHPDATDPERVVIRNTETGASIVGALFRRERENPGPLLQVSSDAAEALNMLPGAPTELNVVALRREEVEVEATPEENPVVASLEAPVSVTAVPLDPADGAAAEAAEAGADVVAVTLPAATTAVAAAAETAEEVADAAADVASDTIDVSAVLATPVAPNPLPSGTVAQVGVYSVEANAGAAAGQIIDAGIPANVLAEEVGGRTVWRVLAGPLTDDGAIATLKSMGFVDAFVVEAADGDDQ